MREVRIGRGRAAALETTPAGPAGWLSLGRRLGSEVPRPGAGSTADLWSTLATLGAADLQLARAVEPHLDALAILDEADAAGFDVSVGAEATWGVFAAEGPGVRLEAERWGNGWLLNGTKPWCSLAGQLDRALVTAWVDDRCRALFAVDLHAPGVSAAAGPGAWSPRGLVDVVSLPVEMSDVPAEPVGPPEWYLRRDGFAWGGMGVAAVWYGGAVGVARRLAQPRGRERDQVSHVHLGTADASLAAARALLAEAASAVDAGFAGGDDGASWALRVRAVVADACEEVLRAAEHDLGPGPQVAEPDHAARLADLRLYLRQHHAERDLAALGRVVEDTGGSW
ncbi:acyl-CoA dehydrogenase family protein [Nocardioides aestuarii]|uniref:Acyl-CoA dehydrogenase n=1 Tax=Nocardioides aestuarii TaxID=252231 RepID=A0ABW4TNR7_9ACTN